MLLPGGVVGEQQFGLAVFVRKEVAVQSYDTGYIHGEYTVHRQWPTGHRPRVAQVIRVGEGDRGLTVVHAHGLRDPAGKGDTPARIAQAHRLAGLAAGFGRTDRTTILCGDLNLLPDSATFAILQAVGLTDLVGFADTRTSRYPKAVRHASYLLTSDTSVVRSFSIVREPEVSDHAAFVLELR